jgi:hypothetical protein
MRVPPAGGGPEGWLTLTVVVPDFPSLVAVITVVPEPMAFSAPLVEMVATDGTLLAQLTGAPEMTFPALSLTVADAWVFCPTAREADATVTLTLDTIEAGVVGDVGDVAKLASNGLSQPIATKSIASAEIIGRSVIRQPLHKNVWRLDWRGGNPL